MSHLIFIQIHLYYDKKMYKQVLLIKILINVSASIESVASATEMLY